MTTRQRGWKRCKHCERNLVLEMFYCDGHGKPDSRCKSCHTKQQKLWWRKTYTTNEAFRAKERARAKARYHSNPAYRRRKVAMAVQYKRRLRAA